MTPKILFSITTLLLSLNPVFAKDYKPSKEAKLAAQVLRAETIRSHTRFLADDLLEGRAPASNGDLIAQSYIASQFERLGMKPVMENQSWFQPFELIGVDTKAPSSLVIAHGSRTYPLSFYKDYIAVSGRQEPSVQVRNAEIVFVGYGIVAPEYGWDDYKDVDVKGKVLLMMNNDPATDPNLFAGKTRLYYGRWTYKYEMAAKKGAIGAIIIHTAPSAGYDWQVVQSSWTGEQFELPPVGEPTIALKSWVTEASARGIAKISGFDLDQLRANAEKKDFRPVPLKSRISIHLKNKVRRVKTANVLGIIPGSDEKLSKEAVIYMAHFDHLGKKDNPKKGEDAIYNGALDNASGVGAILTIAEAYARLEKKPRRSILFAAVGAEESGLLGSAYLAKNPPLPAGKLAAAINIDGVSIWGPTTDVVVVGKGKSSLDAMIESIAAMQGRTVKGDQFPEKGAFYRSDQFNLAKIGVPSAYFDSGVDLVGQPAGAGAKLIQEWEDKHYHQPSDELRPDWNLEGALQDMALDFYLGYEVAKTDEMPTWNKGDEFEAARQQAIQAQGSGSPKVH